MADDTISSAIFSEIFYFIYMDCTLLEWLNADPLPQDIKGDADTGYYLGIEKVNEKLHILKEKFNVRIHFTNFHHFLFNKPDKTVWASGSIQVELISKDGTFHDTLIGAATFDIQEYDNDKEFNSHYAATLKSLAKSNAMLEYPQFGSKLNKQDLVRTIQVRGKKETSDKAKTTAKLL